MELLAGGGGVEEGPSPLSFRSAKSRKNSSAPPPLDLQFVGFGLVV